MSTSDGNSDRIIHVKHNDEINNDTHRVISFTDNDPDNNPSGHIDSTDDDYTTNMPYTRHHENQDETDSEHTQERNQNLYRMLCVAVLFGISWIFSFATDNFNDHVIKQTFIEQDPGLSYPYVDKQHVPSYLLYIVSFLVPLVCLLFAFAMYFSATKTKTSFGSAHSPDAKFKRTKTDKKNIKTYTILIFIGLSGSFFFTRAITNTLKILFGEPRPSFFGICNYQGFRDASISGNYTEYYNLTQFGRYGDVNNCREQNSYEIYDAFMSFPSGHASLSFSGIVYASLILFMFKERSQLHYMFAILTSGGLFTLASWVGFTRVEDYMHKSSDVFAGAFLGSVVAYCVYIFVRDMIDKCKLAKAFISEDYVNRHINS